MKIFGRTHPHIPKVDTPIGWTCEYCEKPFAPIDKGFILPYVSSSSAKHEVAYHQECLFDTLGLNNPEQKEESNG